MDNNKPNRRRINTAFRIVRATDPVGSMDTDQAVQSALSNLLHLCWAYGIDFERTLDAARNDFCAELSAGAN